MAREFEAGEYVMYRNPEKFLAGAADHTVPCRIEPQDNSDLAAMAWGHRLVLRDVRTGELYETADPKFVKRISAKKIMAGLEQSGLLDDSEPEVQARRLPGGESRG